MVKIHGTLTDQEVSDYIKNPHYCPFCKSKNIEASHLEADGAQAWQEITCNECFSKWNDIYNISDIDVITAPAVKDKIDLIPGN